MHRRLEREMFPVDIRRASTVSAITDWAARLKSTQVDLGKAKGELRPRERNYERIAELEAMERALYREFVFIVAMTAPDELVDLDVATVLTEAARVHYEPKRASEPAGAA